MGESHGLREDPGAPDADAVDRAKRAEALRLFDGFEKRQRQFLNFNFRQLNGVSKCSYGVNVNCPIHEPKPHFAIGKAVNVRILAHFFF